MNDFERRHIGTGPVDLEEMLAAIGVSSLDELMDQTVPRDIRISQELNLPEAIGENEYLRKIREIAGTNEMYLNCMGQGYYGTITPSVIRRNIFENPGWYTQYTPYQAEISQGRLEALLNFQTMVSDLCGLPIANASLLDEGTAAAEAMSMFYAVHNKRTKDDPANEFLSKCRPGRILKCQTAPLPSCCSTRIDMGWWKTTRHWQREPKRPALM
jgi:glycine dehydrogenase